MNSTDPSSAPSAERPTEAGRRGRPALLIRVVAVGLGVAVAVVLVGIVPGLLFDRGSRGWWIYMGVGLVLVAVSAADDARRNRRRLGGRDQARMYRRALRDGEVPPDANREAWRAPLERMQRTSRWWVRWYALASLAPALLVLVLSVAVAAMSDSPVGTRVALPLVGVVILGVSLLGYRLRRRNDRRSTALLGQL